MAKNQVCRKQTGGGVNNPSFLLCRKGRNETMKNIIIGIIIGGIVFTLGGVVATTAISSTNVTYQNKTVNTALDELYDKAITGKELVAAAITNKGITTTSSDTYETMAKNIKNIDIDHTEIIGKINNLESKHNNDITSLTGTINNLNQSLDVINRKFSVYDNDLAGNNITEESYIVIMFTF